jgi:hypothetical protein
MQDYANQIAQMFVGWQITIIDLPRLAELGSGHIEINLLSGTTRLNGVPSDPFTIADVVRQWLEDAIERDSLPAGYVQGVSIGCDFDVGESSEDWGTRRTLVLLSSVVVDTENGSWTGESRKSETWEKVGEAPWLVYDS